MFAVVSDVVFWDKQPLSATYSLEFVAFVQPAIVYDLGGKRSGEGED